MIRNSILFCIMFAAPWVVIPDGTLSDSAHMMGNFFLVLCILSGTLLGFSIRSLSIFMSASSHRIVNNMKKTGHYGILVQNFKLTIMLLFMSTIFSLISYFTFEIWIWKTTFAVFGLSLAYLVMTSSRFYKIMSLLEEPEGNPHRLD